MTSTLQARWGGWIRNESVGGHETVACTLTVAAGPGRVPADDRRCAGRANASRPPPGTDPPGPPVPASMAAGRDSTSAPPDRTSSSNSRPRPRAIASRRRSSERAGGGRGDDAGYPRPMSMVRASGTGIWARPADGKRDVPVLRHRRLDAPRAAARRRRSRSFSSATTRSSARHSTSMSPAVSRSRQRATRSSWCSRVPAPQSPLRLPPSVPSPPSHGRPKSAPFVSEWGFTLEKARSAATITSASTSTGRPASRRPRMAARSCCRRRPAGSPRDRFPTASRCEISVNSGSRTSTDPSA